MKFNLEDFFFNIPLYTKIEIDKNYDREFSTIVYSASSIDIDGYNPIRKIQTTYEVVRVLSYGVNDFMNNGGFAEVRIKCKRYGDLIRYYCVYDSSSKILMKIGQFPSVADIHIHEIKQFDKVIAKEKLKEFTKAIGLAANGVGIGSFVYLRRIFEHLIYEAYQNATTDNVLSEADFQRSRMAQRIEMLKNYLPDFLVEHKEMYSILSLGIHELDEDTCLANFDTLRIGIEIILEEKLETLRKVEKINQAKQKIKDLKNSIKK